MRRDFKRRIPTYTCTHLYLDTHTYVMLLPSGYVLLVCTITISVHAGRITDPVAMQKLLDDYESEITPLYYGRGQANLDHDQHPTDDNNFIRVSVTHYRRVSLCITYI